MNNNMPYLGSNALPNQPVMPANIMPQEQMTAPLAYPVHYGGCCYPMYDPCCHPVYDPCCFPIYNPCCPPNPCCYPMIHPCC